MNNPPDPHSARFAKVAWPIVSEREGLPRPAADTPDEDEPERPRFNHWVEADYPANDDEPPPYPLLTRVVIIFGGIAATWGFLWIVIRGGLKLAGVI